MAIILSRPQCVKAQHFEPTSLATWTPSDPIEEYQYITGRDFLLSIDGLSKHFFPYTPRITQSPLGEAVWN